MEEIHNNSTQHNRNVEHSYCGSVESPPPPGAKDVFVWLTDTLSSPSDFCF